MCASVRTVPAASLTVTVKVEVLLPSARIPVGEAVMVERVGLGAPGGGAMTRIVPVSPSKTLGSAWLAWTVPSVPATAALKTKLDCGPARTPGSDPVVVHIAETSWR